MATRSGSLSIRTLWSVLLTVVVALGVLGAPAARGDREACPPHPYPCGDEWPRGLDGPFALLGGKAERVEVVAHDGVVLRGWVARPALPAGVRAPVVLTAHPYFGNVIHTGHTVETPEDPAFFSEAPGFGALLSSLGLGPIDFVRRGYAMAFFAVRGSSVSGGCFGFMGPDEQRDQATVVQWLARQPWSNGRVGMQGLSYLGTTPFEAGIQAPPGLKTIIAGGIHSDLYTSAASPQGAWSVSTVLMSVFPVAYSIGPPVLADPAQQSQRPMQERICPDLVQLTAGVDTEFAREDRDAAFWKARRLVDRFDRVTASVLMFHGFQDGWYGDTWHGTQDDWVWQALRHAPQRHLMGQWPHEYPVEGIGSFPSSWRHHDWRSIVHAWNDYWLKGLGPRPERLGTVEYQDSSGAWQSSRSWPPAAAKDEILDLGGDSLAPRRGWGSRTFLSWRDPRNAWEMAHHGGTFANGEPLDGPFPALCRTALDTAVPSGLLYRTAPVRRGTLVAGNPFLDLRLRSDQPGGIVNALLLDVAPNSTCDATGTPSGVAFVTRGAADLRFHDGRYVGHDFPTGTTHTVRLDFEGISHRLAPGHRLALVLDRGGVGEGQPYAPLITVDGVSQLVLPVVSGTFGGLRPHGTYLPRPFLPPALTPCTTRAVASWTRCARG